MSGSAPSDGGSLAAIADGAPAVASCHCLVAGDERELPIVYGLGSRDRAPLLGSWIEALPESFPAAAASSPWYPPGPHLLVDGDIALAQRAREFQRVGAVQVPVYLGHRVGGYHASVHELLDHWCAPDGARQVEST